jgi:CheY-like chemotaxis protein
MVSMLRDLLEATGYRAVTAYSGAEALATVEREEPDLMIKASARSGETMPRKEQAAELIQGCRERSRYVALLVREYNEAKEYYTNLAGFEVLEDGTLANGKRGVVLAPPRLLTQKQVDPPALRA